MAARQEFPVFDELLPDLHQFILDLVEAYQAEKIKSWDDLEERVHAFFTPERMDRIEKVVPHWRKMASYIDGFTLLHVMCAFLGLYMLPEFLQMTGRQQQIMKWVILFHDVEKVPQHGKRDHPHAFRSTVGAAWALPKLGFPTTGEYDACIADWDAWTRSAVRLTEDAGVLVQDNHKLPAILDGIERMFGRNTTGALILKTILFHLAVYLDFWPPPAPLTDEEMKRYFDRELLALLRVMHLADGEGWQLFAPQTRQSVRDGTLAIFERVERLITESFQTPF